MLGGSIGANLFDIVVIAELEKLEHRCGACCKDKMMCDNGSLNDAVLLLVGLWVVACTAAAHGAEQKKPPSEM